MHRQEGADAVARPMVEIHARHPKRRARQRVQIAPRQPLWPAGAADGDHPGEDAGIGLGRPVRHWAHGHGPGDVGGAVDILPARINKQQLSGADGAIGGFGHAVMHDGAVRTGTCDCLETDVLQGVVGAAAVFKRCHNLGL